MSMSIGRGIAMPVRRLSIRSPTKATTLFKPRVLMDNYTSGISSATSATAVSAGTVVVADVSWDKVKTASSSKIRIVLRMFVYHFFSVLI